MGHEHWKLDHVRQGSGPVERQKCGHTLPAALVGVGAVVACRRSSGTRCNNKGSRCAAPVKHGACERKGCSQYRQLCRRRMRCKRRCASLCIRSVCVAVGALEAHRSGSAQRKDKSDHTITDDIAIHKVRWGCCDRHVHSVIYQGK